MTALYKPRPEFWPWFNLREFCVLVTVLCVVSCWIGGKIDSSRFEPEEIKIRAALDSSTSFEFKNTPLQDVVDYLKEYHDVEIQLDLKAFEELDIPFDVKVTSTIRGVPLRSALKTLLSKINPSLTIAIKYEVLMVSSKRRANEWQRQRPYLVRN